MLARHTHERLIALGLAGMAKAFEEQRRSPDIAALSFEERCGQARIEKKETQKRLRRDPVSQND